MCYKCKLGSSLGKVLSMMFICESNDKPNSNSPEIVELIEFVSTNSGKALDLVWYEAYEFYKMKHDECKKHKKVYAEEIYFLNDLTEYFKTIYDKDRFSVSLDIEDKISANIKNIQRDTEKLHEKVYKRNIQREYEREYLKSYKSQQRMLIIIMTLTFIVFSILLTFIYYSITGKI